MNGNIGENFCITQDGVLTIKGRVCMPDVEDLKRLIMEEDIVQPTLCIQVVPRCIGLSKRVIGGLV